MARLPEVAEVDIELAYSIRCHKAQGSSVDVIVIVEENCPLVSREWLYAGIMKEQVLAVAR